ILSTTATGRLMMTLPPVDAGNVPTGLSVADINRDGNLDLLVGNEFGDVLIILGNGDGTFRPFTRADRAVPFVVTDLAGRGARDVILANQAVDQVVSQVRVPGSNTFTPGNFAQNRSDGLVGPGAITQADINGDGRPDVIVANSGSNNVLVYLRQADGSL